MIAVLGYWMTSLFTNRRRQLVATVGGIAVTVALLATLFGFTSYAQANMTKQAIAGVSVDWQIQLAPGTDPAIAVDELKSSPGAQRIAEVGYANSLGFENTTGSTTQTTGPGKVLGIPPDYHTLFPAQIRNLIGQGSVLLAQQTAANLHAAPGDTIRVDRPGAPPIDVTIDAIVDLPLADSLFQIVGAPAGATPQAPPDNVLILPLDQWHQVFDPVAGIDPAAATMQLHATLGRQLSASPTSAYLQITRMARNYEARLAGGALVGDNLAAQLDAARSDALYAALLMLFLGLPGVILACLLTTLVVSASATSRRRNQALLRLRGASQRQILVLATADALVIGLVGALAGLALGALTLRLTFHRWSLGNATSSTIAWGLAAALVGIAVSLLAILVPAWRDNRQLTVATARQTVRRDSTPLWQRMGLDFLLIAASGVVYWNARRHGYEVLLAPEGVPRVTISYTSLLGPLLLWAGGALLAMRCTRLLLHNDAGVVSRWLAPGSGRLSRYVGITLQRDRTALSRGVALVAVAIAFAASTAIFNATYEHQSLVDAQLTNGADVSVQASQTIDLTPRIDAVRALPGVLAAEPLQHRFAYVGSDLQDLYGIVPATLQQAAPLSDAYFVGASTNDVMSRLANTPNGLLVSPETVSDYQLQLGDTVKLQLQSAADHQYHPVAFTYVGIAREFPTAPSDSFLVANATYIAQQTGSPMVSTLLIKTDSSPSEVAGRVRVLLGPTSGTTVRDIEASRQVIRSNLTAVSLHGLTRIELGLAVLLAAAGAGLVFVLGQDERRRSLAIVSAIGATPRQLTSFVWGQAALIATAGIAGGALLGWGIAYMLVKLLTHVFDPPPQQEIVPWYYLALVVVAAIGAVGVAAQAVIRSTRQRQIETIRQL